jgi:hypothetical protein
MRAEAAAEGRRRRGLGAEAAEAASGRGQTRTMYTCIHSLPVWPRADSDYVYMHTQPASLASDSCGPAEPES